MSWYSSGPPVDTSSLRYKICLHETAHAVAARQLDWRNIRVEVDDTSGWMQGDPPRGLSPDELALQRAVVALAGPVASLRVSWFMPSGCSWDQDHARKVLRGTRVRHNDAKALAGQLVGRNWGQTQRQARGLYLTGGRS
jgi:hypothetical protein